MLKKRNIIFLSLLILGALLLSSCFLNPPVTEGILKGQVMVPEGTLKTKDLTGQALPDATVNIIDLATGTIIATTTTDSDGYYQVSVPPGGPYLLEATKDGVKLEQMTCQVEVGIEYDLGTADCTTTAAALIAQAMMDAGDNPADIDCDAIIADPNFDDVSSIVCSTIKAGQDPTTSALVQQAVEDFLNPPEPAPTPTPTPTYTVTFDSQGGSAVNSQTITRGAKVTEPTIPTRTGYAFSGWYKEPECITAWVFTTDTVTANVTLYAQWVSLEYYVSKSGSDDNDGSANYPWLTIDYALLHTPDDGTIHVADGTYAESITFPDGKVITLQSVNGPLSTTIIGDDNSATVTCSNSPNGTTLEGFTITHDSGKSGSGIAISAGYLTINNCTISNNSANNGGGIYNNYGTLIITGSTVDTNSADLNGGGIANVSGTLTITGSSTILNNSAGAGGGGIYSYYLDSLLIITGSTISGNSAETGGGILNYGTLNITSSSTILNNSAETGGGGGIFNIGILNISDSTISNNSTTYTGGGISNVSGTLTITGSTISNNSAEFSGGAIWNQDTLNITGSTLSNNSADQTGGGIWIYIVSTSSTTIQGNTISGNTSSTGGGIYIAAGSPIIGGTDGSDTANFNTICGNTPDQINPESYPFNYIFTNCDVIGETGPAGGVIFYDKGDVSDGWRYLEAALSDQSIGAFWGCEGTLISGADGTAVGTGKQNTLDIDAGCLTEGIAADICANLSLGGYDDWFLPSRYELYELYLNRVVIGGFTGIYYWSSSESDADYANCQDFNTGANNWVDYKDAGHYVRAVRAF